jgi:hypothetical protein
MIPRMAMVCHTLCVLLFMQLRDFLVLNFVIVLLLCRT